MKFVGFILQILRKNELSRDRTKKNRSNMEVCIKNDDYKSEATITYTISGFSKVKRDKFSPVTMVRGLPWRIMIKPKVQHTFFRKRGNNITQEYVGLYLQCNADSKLMSWSCRANAVLHVKSQKKGVADFKKEISHTFNPLESDWGLTDFLLRQTILDPKSGYIKHNTVTFEIFVSADPPSGIHVDESSSIRLGYYVKGNKLLANESTTWLGLDRYGKIVYGYYWYGGRNTTGEKQELVLRKLCLFTRKMSDFKRISFKRFVTKQHQHYRECSLNVAISKNGEHVGIVTCLPTDKFLFCLLNLETETIHTFNIEQKSIEHSLCFCDSLFLFSNGNQWIVKILLPQRKICQYFGLVIDEFLRVGLLNFITEYECDEHSDREGDELFLGDKMVIVNQANGMLAKMCVFSFVSKQWTVINMLQDVNIPSLPKMYIRYACYKYKVYQDHDKNLFALSENEEQDLFLRYDDVTNMWSRINIKTNQPFDWISNISIFATTSCHALIETKGWSRDSPSVETFVNLINVTHVLSLRDICFMKLLEPHCNCVKLCCCLNLFTEEKILQCEIFTNLSQYLKRMYFGPKFCKFYEEIFPVTKKSSCEKRKLPRRDRHPPKRLYDEYLRK